MHNSQNESKENSKNPATNIQGNFSRLGEILSDYLKLNEQEKQKRNSSFIPPPKKDHLTILLWLKPVPWILLSVFVISFFWDFGGISAEPFGYELRFEGVLKIISVSGMIGFLTNWIAITMLFRPLKKRPLLGQGLIPAHKKRIAYRLAYAVSEDLINPELIKKKIGDSKAISRYREQALGKINSVLQKPEFRRDLKRWLLDYISSTIQNPEFRKSLAAQIYSELETSLEDRVVEKAALKTYSFLRGLPMQNLIEEALEKLPVSAERNIDSIEKILDDLPAQIERNGEKLDEIITTLLFRLINQLDVQNLVEENLRKYDEEKLELMIRNATNEQLKTIQYLGAVLGTIGGFVIWQPLPSLIILATIFGSVYFLDQKIYN